GEFYRRMRWRLGAPAAVTATAHKLARIVYHLLSTKKPYSESVLAHCDHLANKRAEIRLRKQAANLGYQLTPIPEPNT
ncbi:MAG: IS110 family transposase, partial [Candidatus Sulfotelmatobacter sp.]